MAAPRLTLTICVSVLLAACGGGGGDDNPAPTPAPTPPPAPTTFAVGGTVSGLDAVGLVLQNNGGPDLAISGNGEFAFPAQLASGASYSVTIKSQPNIGPLQVCSLTNGSGTVASSAITSVAIACTSRVFKFLYVTSTFSNDLRGYSINASNGMLTAVPGTPVATGPGPNIPISEPTGKYLFLSMRGSAIEPPRVAVYSADNATGALTEIPGSPYDLDIPPPPAGAVAVAPVSIHRSGAFGYLPVFYPASLSTPSSTLLYGATIDAASGQLTEIPGMPIDLGSGTSGTSYDSTGSFLFSPWNPNGAGQMRSFRVDTPSGILTPIGSVATSGGGPVGAFLTPGDDYLLTTHINSGTVVAFAVNKTAGTLTPLTSPPVPTGPAGSQPVGISFNRRNNVFYTTNITGGPLTVAAFRLDSATGGITSVGSPVDTNGAEASVFLHQSGRFLFQYNRRTPSIQRYALDPTTGAPTLMTQATALPGATSVSMIQDVSGKYLYVTSPGTSTLSSYSIDAATGALTLINSVPTSSGGLATVPFLLQ